MARHLRNRNVGDDDDDNSGQNAGFTDGNGIVHTTSRSLRKINYSELNDGLDFQDDENEVPMGEKGDVPSKDEDTDNHKDAGMGIDPQENNEVPNDNIENAQQDDANDAMLEDGELVGGHNLRKRSRKHHMGEDDDESFHEEDAIEEEDDDEGIDYGHKNHRSANTHQNYLERKRDRNFIVSDEDDDDEDNNEDADADAYGYGHYGGSSRRSKRRLQQSKSRSTRTRSGRRLRTTTPPPTTRSLRSTRSRTRQQEETGHDDNEATDRDDEDDHVTLADEIRELEEDSPIREKRSLRERTKPVNYTIPPPLSSANAEEYLRQQNMQGTNTSMYNPSPSTRRGRNNANIGPTRRLFPTGGPFGGNDVITVFGENANFYGVNNFPNVALNNNPNNKLILDSDSSDDEILPLGAEPKPKKLDAKKKKKKPEIADLDPLGIDMDINFDDVGGLDNYIDQLKEMVALPLLYPELYQNFNITPPRGVLFHGPPGTGKTLMARALAASCSTETRKITFFMRKGADILSKWVGEAERQLRLLFEEAKKQQPSIIFFDEIDGLAPVRSSKQEQIHASIVSTMLALMDGMDNRGQVIVIGATNRPDAVDPALRRPGRFDREFYFPLPDEKARAKILSIHTKKWTPSLNENFIANLARLTKGYGGADLRALCTEAALFSIQRKFPQIYRSEEKLQVDRSKLKVTTSDFMLALQKIVPSSARSTGSVPEPLPETVRPLLQHQFEEIKKLLERMLPNDSSHLKRDSSLIQHYIDYEDYEEDETMESIGCDGDRISAFGKHELLNQIAKSRICKPRLLITGPIGNGQQYIGAAILNYLEHYNVQKLDVASLVSESSRSIEAAIVQGFVEARKRQPSIIYIPNLDIWSRTIPSTAILTLASLLRSLQSNERILLLGISEKLTEEDLLQEPLSHLALETKIYNVNRPSRKQRHEFFKRVRDILSMKPSEFKVERKRKRPLPKLPLAGRETIASNLDENGNLLSPEEVLRKNLKAFQYQDMKLKNVIKIKLSGLMDLFVKRYKRFRKPPIEDALLVHLFEPQPIDPSWQPAYVKDNDMILEVATGRKFYNMDLDIVEERLWNGFYSGPKQFLKDIELIYIDANTTGDRERIIKASEMFANAQMGIEDISQPELLKACKELRKRDSEREALALKDAEKEQAALTLETKAVTDEPTSVSENTHIQEVGTGAGTQLQAQLQVNPPANTEIQDASVTEPDDTTKISQEQSDDIPQGNIAEKIPQVEPIESTLKPEVLIAIETPQQETTVPAVENEQATLGNGITINHIANDGDVKMEQHVPNVKNDVLIEPQAQQDLPNHSVSVDSLQNIDTPKEFKSVHETSVVVDGEKESNKVNEEIDQPEQSEEVEEPESDFEKELILPQSDVDYFLESLGEKSKNATVSTLEEIYSHIMDIIWEDRLNWDRTETLKKLIDFTGV